MNRERREQHVRPVLVKDDGGSTFFGTTGHNSAKLYLFQPHFASRLAKEAQSVIYGSNHWSAGLLFRRRKKRTSGQSCICQWSIIRVGILSNSICRSLNAHRVMPFAPPLILEQEFIVCACKKIAKLLTENHNFILFCAKCVTWLRSQRSY